jgi:hypothetical protein
VCVRVRVNAMVVAGLLGCIYGISRLSRSLLPHPRIDAGGPLS